MPGILRCHNMSAFDPTKYMEENSKRLLPLDDKHWSVRDKLAREEMGAEMQSEIDSLNTKLQAAITRAGNWALHLDKARKENEALVQRIAMLESSLL